MHPPHLDPTSEKVRLRAEFDRYRRHLSSKEVEGISDSIADRAAQLPEIACAGVVHVYWPLLDRGEIDTRPLIVLLQDRGAEIVLPVVRTFEQEEPPRLSHVRFPGEERLRANRWGIAEPDAGEAVEIERLDAVIVPTLGAGRNRHRIGHGRGFYDAFLSQLAVPAIGLTYAACLRRHVPYEDHDVRLDVIVTEQEVVREGDL